MAYRQVVMVSCIEDHTSPRVRIRDDFMAIAVSDLGDGDEAWMEPEGFQPIRLHSGLSPFPKTAATHFRVRKQSGPNPQPTSIEVHRGH